MEWLPLDWPQIAASLAKIAVAYLLALPVGWDRERAARSAGIRTFPLVAVASCGFMLLAEHNFENDADAQARVLEGLMTGIGFIGGGAILKGRASVHGTATAASIWNTGALGAAVAFGNYEVAIVLSAINFVTLRLIGPLMKEDEV